MLVCSPAKNRRPNGRASHGRSAGSNAGIEVRVAAARPRVGFPDGLPRRDQLGVLLARATRARASAPACRLCATSACVASLAPPPASSDRMPARPRCSSLPSQTRAERQRRSERARPARHAPEPSRELQQRLGRAAVFEPRDRVVLLRRERRRDRDAAQQRGRQREQQVVGADRRHRPAAAYAGADAASAMRDGDQLGVQTQRGRRAAPPAPLASRSLPPSMRYIDPGAGASLDAN